MDIKHLKTHLIENPDYVEEILEKYFDNVRYYESSKQWRFSFLEGDDPSSSRLSSESLYYKNYKYNEESDIFTLFMKKLNINLGKCLNMFCDSSCYIESDYKIKEVFGGFYKKISNSKEGEIPSYPSNKIECYPEVVSKFFLKEGITIESQNKFNIRLDVETNRIIIPVYLKSKLVGAIGRFNSKVSGDIPRYLPILKYPKSKVLFGYDVNYASLYNNTIILVESEKTVIRAFGTGYKNLLALGGNSISHFQRNLIYSLNPKEVILVLDKGLGKDKAIEFGLDSKQYMKSVIEKECNKLKSKNVFINFKVSYIDMNEFDEVEDKENIFEMEEINIKKYIDKRIKV